MWGGACRKKFVEPGIPVPVEENEVDLVKSGGDNIL